MCPSLSRARRRKPCAFCVSMLLITSSCLSSLVLFEGRIVVDVGPNFSDDAGTDAESRESLLSSVLSSYSTRCSIPNSISLPTSDSSSNSISPPTFESSSVVRSIEGGAEMTAGRTDPLCSGTVSTERWLGSGHSMRHRSRFDCLKKTRTGSSGCGVLRRCRRNDRR